MYIAEVVGNVWGTTKHPSLEGKTMLLVRAIDPITDKPTGEILMAVDTVGAGPGSVVLVVDEGSSARQMLKDPKAPLRTVICGIVDRVTGV